MRIKKTVVPDGQKRLDVRQKRLAWPLRLADMPVRRLVFIGESSANTALAKLRGWGPKGQRLRSSVPCGRWQTVTMICGIRHDGACAPGLIDGPMDGPAFLAYLEQQLLPELEAGDVLVMDNLSTHKVAGVAELCGRFGVEVLYLPPYSPDLNPIENLWSKVKAFLRKLAARSLLSLSCGMAEALDAVTPQECQGYFRHAGYRSQTF
jgi:transposase